MNSLTAPVMLNASELLIIEDQLVPHDLFEIPLTLEQLVLKLAPLYLALVGKENGEELPVSLTYRELLILRNHTPVFSQIGINNIGIALRRKIYTALLSLIPNYAEIPTAFLQALDGSLDPDFKGGDLVNTNTSDDPDPYPSS